jgi:beta-mannanase
MKKVVLYILIFVGVLMFVRFVINHKKLIYNLLGLWEANTIEKSSSDPVLAVFSFQTGTLKPVSSTLPHYIIKLNNIRNWKIQREAISEIEDSIPLFITVEAWGGNVNSKYFNNPVEDVIAGKFDYVFKQLCTQLIRNRTNVFFRFNPEMEVPVHYFPWQRIGPDYILAFRHFSAICKTYAPQVKQVWGPSGYPGLTEYYPGDDLVDVASVTLKSNSETFINKYPKDYSIEYDLYRRFHRLRFFNKPIFVLGSKQVPFNSINDGVISFISDQINNARSIAYSTENFNREELKYKSNQQRNLEIGLYDPQSLLIAEKPVTVEHLFVDFGSLSDGTFQSNFNKVVGRRHNVIVTFEPFRNPNGELDLQVLQNVTKGKYDQEISKLYSIIKSTSNLVYLRYAHEMEIPVTRYPWQSQDPVNYIKSFRYFMTFQKPFPANIRRIWGPAGDRGSLEWWPGNDVVDFISIAIYGLPDKNITDPKKQESFSTIFKRKYWRMRFVAKPIFITEFGVKGPEEYKTVWLEDAAKVIRDNPQIVGINYFNMSDTPKAWGDIEPPDWSISKKSFYQFLKVLKE